MPLVRLSLALASRASSSGAFLVAFFQQNVLEDLQVLLLLLMMLVQVLVPVLAQLLVVLLLLLSRVSPARASREPLLPASLPPSHLLMVLQMVNESCSSGHCTRVSCSDGSHQTWHRIVDNYRRTYGSNVCLPEDGVSGPCTVECATGLEIHMNCPVLGSSVLRSKQQSDVCLTCKR